MASATAAAAAAETELVDLRALPASDRLRLRRCFAGWKQWQAAQRLGVPQPTLSLAESGRLDAARAAALDRALAALVTDGQAPARGAAGLVTADPGSPGRPERRCGKSEGGAAREAAPPRRRRGVESPARRGWTPDEPDEDG